MTLSPHGQTSAHLAPRQVVDALFAAIQSGNRDRILALLSDGVEWWVAGSIRDPVCRLLSGAG